MGADGGINWIEIIDNSKRNRLEELLKPFDAFLYFDDYHYSNYEKAKKINEEYNYNVIITTYGTNQDLEGVESLKDLIIEITESYNKNYEYYDFTWIEVIEDLLTASYLPYYKSNVQECVTYHFNLNKYEENPDFKNILDMKLIDWANEIKSIVDIHSVYSMETWT